MSIESGLGKQLYELLPEVFRNRDNAVYDADGRICKNGDMAQFLDAHGYFLDRIKATLEQRLADCFADTPIDGGQVCQDWLLPYFADLLDVRLASPDPAGQRQEISNAISWRKGKGTASVVERITESISGVEAELQEGWRRVAITPRIGAPVRPDTASGRNLDISAQGEVISAIGFRYPGLPVTTPDFRWASRTMQTDATDPLARASCFGPELSTHWLHANPHGVPCFAGSYEDVSRRTVDIRTPDWLQGHVHPERLLIYMPPFTGFFAENIVNVRWRDRLHADSTFAQWIEVHDSDDGCTIYRNKSLHGNHFQPVCIRQIIELGMDHEGDADAHLWRFEGLILDNAVIMHGGRLELEACALRKLELRSRDLSEPLLSARHCLFKTIENPHGLSRLEYCTVLQRTVSQAIEASDCIFIGYIQKDSPSLAPPVSGCMRYCSVHPRQTGGGATMYRASISRDYVRMFSLTFGKPGCGVLHPQSSDKVCFGAEDGGEMGAYHDRHYSLRWRAVTDKLGDYLPLGLQAVLIPDERLACRPPEQGIKE